jgi:hypothetical protein
VSGWKRHGAVLVLSVLGALAIAETGAALLHQRAYPFLNLFQADPRYGVRLRPDASTRVRSRNGTITPIATNALGFRGPEWPSSPPTAERVLLLGDSQVFGFGVPHEHTFGARLAAQTGAEVLNAAVPSWGPAEFQQAVIDLAPRFRPTTVIYVANLANDWFENAVANSKRTTALDGWAVRYSDEAQPVLAFPGREFLLGRSHLVLAVRQLAEHQRMMRDGGMPADTATTLARDLPQLSRPSGAHRSRLTPSLMEVLRSCRGLGCSVVAVALPIDVQVDAREWKKYRGAPIDLSGTERLLEDWVDDARQAGLPAINLLPVLRDASPGAFQDDDYHLSARGHAAIAGALAKIMRDRTRSAQVTR